MAREGHIGDAAGAWNAINRELWQVLGTKVPIEALIRIRQIRTSRNGKQGATEMKREGKILLAIRDNIDWRIAESLEVDHKISVKNGGRDVASNLQLLWQYDNQRKGSRNAT